MKRIEKLLSTPNAAEIAAKAQLRPETFSRIVHGKQSPSFRPGGSAERIAEAVGWQGDVRALFEEASGDDR